MKLKTIFTFVTGVSVGSVITAMEIGRTISKNDVAKQAIADVIHQKTDDILFRGKNPKHKDVKTELDGVGFNGLYKKKPKNEEMMVYESVYSTKEDAESVVKALNEIVDLYGVASISDYKDLIGLDPLMRDRDFGWDDEVPYIIEKKETSFIDYPTHYEYILKLGNAKRL